MLARHFLTVAVTLALPSSVFAQASSASKARTQKDEARLVVMPSSDLKWTDVDPTGAPGVKFAPLWGNLAKGAFGAFFRLPAGFVAPLHTHTNDLKVVIVSGTYIQAPEGKPEFRLGPGSYFFQPGGNYRHTTSCGTDSDCVFFVEGKGKFDLKPVATGNVSAKE